MTPGKIAAHNAQRAQWNADGGWAQVPAGAMSGVSRGTTNVAAGFGWLGATAASGYEQLAFGTNYSGEFASALMNEADSFNKGSSQIAADHLGVSVDGAFFKDVEGASELA
ncbi:hypothetical protein GCM10007047_34370 [Cerasicoccus arenae]|uniref:Uncharacterized protein n=2 Tax=Cerasicoccus arenae TaxID=424488 RepID=A0A8J3DFG7_9BACT|nr:hypothetical protein GCM10007047_34370 [Cerasicoccus arenae]